MTLIIWETNLNSKQMRGTLTTMPPNIQKNNIYRHIHISGIFLCFRLPHLTSHLAQKILKSILKALYLLEDYIHCHKGHIPSGASHSGDLSCVYNLLQSNVITSIDSAVIIHKKVLAIHDIQNFYIVIVPASRITLPDRFQYWPSSVTTDHHL